MRAFYRVPQALWADPEGPAGQLVRCGETTASVYAIAAEQLPAAEATGAVFLGGRVSELTATVQKYFLRTRVRRGTGDDATDLLVRPDQVQPADEVLETDLLAALFAGDAPADLR